MLKKALFFLLFACALATGEAAAQRRIQFGLRAGISMQEMNYPDPAAIDGYKDLKADGRVGFHLGLLSRIRLLGVGSGVMGMGLYLQPEIVYTQSRYGMALTSVEEGGGSLGSKIQMQTIDVPVMLSFKLSIVRIGAGPAFKIFEKTVSKNDRIDVSSIRPTVGYTFGASIDLGRRFIVDARYTGQFRKVRQSVSVKQELPGYDLEGRLSSWSLGIGIAF